MNTLRQIEEYHHREVKITYTQRERHALPMALTLMVTTTRNRSPRWRWRCRWGSHGLPPHVVYVVIVMVALTLTGGSDE